MSLRMVVGVVLLCSGGSASLAQSSGKLQFGNTRYEEMMQGYGKKSMDRAGDGEEALPPVAAGALSGDVAAEQGVSNWAQYDADRQAYADALARHDASADIKQDRYAHQQVAYAKAMRDWRRQVRACHQGKAELCKAPAPDPATYY